MAALPVWTCAVCARAYSAASVGRRDCRVHLGTLDPFTRHYSCCNAAPRGADCKTHCESQRPPGCVRIDHVQSYDERVKISSERPFTCVSLKQAVHRMPHAFKPIDGEVFVIASQQDMDSTKVVRVAVPDSWRGVSDDGTIEVNLMDEYALLCEALGISNTVQYRGDDVYHESGMRVADSDSHDTFVPFVVMVRISPTTETRHTDTPCTM